MSSCPKLEFGPGIVRIVTLPAVVQKTKERLIHIHDEQPLRAGIRVRHEPIVATCPPHHYADIMNSCGKPERVHAQPVTSLQNTELERTTQPGDT